MRVRQVLGCQLAGRIHPPALANRTDRRRIVFLALVDERAVDLAGRELDESLDPDVERRLHDLMRAQHVHFHRRDRVPVDRVHACDRRAVDHDVAAVDRAPDRVVVHHVTLHEVQVRMSVDMGELNRIAMEVVVHDHLVGVEEPLDQMRSDESGASRDADPFS